MSAALGDIIKCLNKYFNEKIQEEWDNSGLVYGDKNKIINNIIVCLDMDEDIIYKAVATRSELIVCHHPLIFKPLYSLANNSYKEKILLKAVKNDICIYCIHTPADKAAGGINYKNAEKLGLKNIKPILAGSEYLYTVEFTADEKDFYKITDYLYASNFGNIITGKDIYNKLTIKGNVSYENLNTGIKKIQNNFNILNFNIYKTNILRTDICSFITGEINEMDYIEFADHVKKTFGLERIKIGGYLKGKIKKAAVCSGAGRSFIGDVYKTGSDAYVTGDLTHHDFQSAFENKTMLIDASHYGTEKIFLEIISNIIIGANIGLNKDNITRVEQKNHFEKII